MEASFSINEDLLVENMKKESLVATLLVYERVMKEGGVSEVHIGKQMIDDVDKASK